MIYGSAVFLVHLLAIFLILGFAYIVWILANKEIGWVKLTGQVFACGIAVIVLLAVLYASFYGCGLYGRYGKGAGMMMGGQQGQKMMMQEMMKNPEMMREMMDKQSN